MAVSPGPGTVEKRLLNSVPLYINRIRGGSEVVCTSVRLMIHNFSQLKENVIYTNVLPNFSWGYYIIKSKKVLTIAIFTRVFDMDMECYVCYEQNGHSKKSFELKEFLGGLYEAKMPLKFIQVPENSDLRRDIVNIQIKFDKCRTRHLTTRPFVSKGNDSCIEKLSGDFRNLSPHRISKPNFVVDLKECLMLIHKEILAARSKLFYTFCIRNIDQGTRAYFEMETKKSAVDKIVVYMYLGEIEAVDLQELGNLLILASKFKIPSIQSMCTEALIDKINVLNAGEIKEVAIKSGERSLLTAVNRYFEQYNIQVLAPTEEDESSV